LFRLSCVHDDGRNQRTSELKEKNRRKKSGFLMMGKNRGDKFENKNK
jgi:hypothetical protein